MCKFERRRFWPRIIQVFVKHLNFCGKIKEKFETLSE